MKHSPPGRQHTPDRTQVRSPKALVAAIGSLANVRVYHSWAGPVSLPIDWRARLVSGTDFCRAYSRDLAKKASAARLALPEYTSTCGIQSLNGLALG